MTVIYGCLTVAIVGLIYAMYNYKKVKQREEGSKKMQEIASAIRIGANTFIRYEYKVLAVTAILIFALIAVFLYLPAAIAFALGVFLSGSAGWIGMKIATYANVRVTNEARTTKDIGKTLKVALQGGSVMGVCVSALGLLGVCVCFILFEDKIKIPSMINWAKLEVVPFVLTISSYSLGCSVIALFNRVGGGIYTKAADMGADLVGKTEEDIPEDDPRNPATIADNVGDNVGDVAGLGSDLLESYVGAIVSAIILIMSVYANKIDEVLLQKMYLYPIIFAALGLISSLIGISYCLFKKAGTNPHKELNNATLISAGITIVSTLVCSIVIFKTNTFEGLPFTAGYLSPWIAAITGIVSGVLIGMIAEYYTSYDYNPTRKIAISSKEGAAIGITQGLSVGMISCMLPVIVVGVALIIAHSVAGIFGVAMAAVGMLSFVATTVSVDTYGPISDNAGGIAEMAELDEDVRKITDKLDSVGNTTAAIGKGFAIGSAAFAALSLMVSYLYSFIPEGQDLVMNLMNKLVLVGVLVGAALPYFFSGILIQAVGNAAQNMVEEVRRQFREIVGLREGEAKPDYEKCIDISTKGALKEMKIPALLAIVVPVMSGFLFGPYFVAGILFGATVSAIMLAIFTGNAGGAWDNSKKFIEAGGIEGEGKGSEAHHAAVVGDTVGDPLKDTVGPSLDILIKIMATISLIAASVFAQYNLWDYVSKLFG